MEAAVEVHSTPADRIRSNGAQAKVREQIALFYAAEVVMGARKDRLTIRVTRLIETSEEGPLAIVAVLVVFFGMIAARALGWL
jgi:hypothetical protein